MIIRTIYPVALTKHRGNLCRRSESALLADSAVQAYIMDEWFNNLPVTGDPG